MSKNGVTQAIQDKEWEDLKNQVNSVIRLFGGLLFMPVILVIGFVYGIRAGILAGMEKVLEMLRVWGDQ